MAEKNIDEPSRPPVPAHKTEVKNNLDDEIYEEVDAFKVFFPIPSRTGCSSLFDDTSIFGAPSPTNSYVSVSEFQEYENNTTRREEYSYEAAGNKNTLYSIPTQARGDSQYTYSYCNDYSSRLHMPPTLRKK